MSIAWSYLVRRRVPAPPWSLEHATFTLDALGRLPAAVLHAIDGAAIVDLARCDDGPPVRRVRSLVGWTLVLGLAALFAASLHASGAVGAASAPVGAFMTMVVLAMHGSVCAITAVMLVPSELIEPDDPETRANADRAETRTLLVGTWPTLATGTVLLIVAAGADAAGVPGGGRVTLGTGTLLAVPAPVVWAACVRRRARRAMARSAGFEDLLASLFAAALAALVAAIIVGIGAISIGVLVGWIAGSP